MFSWQDGSGEIINESVDKYENHFERIFPLFEYIPTTEGEGYDFSLAGAEKLAAFIDQRIASNLPVAIPEGYEERVY